MSEAQVTTTLVTPTSTESTAAATPEVVLPAVKTVEPEAAKAEDPQFSRKFNALSKREQALRAKEASLKASEENYKQYQSQLELSKTNPLELLKAHGTSLEDLIAYAVNGEQAPSETAVMKSELDAVKAKIAEYEEEGTKYQEARKQKQKEGTLAAINEEIKTFIHQAGDTYELIKLNKVENEVWQLIEQTYIASEGETTLTQEQAAEMLENYLMQEAEEAANKIEQFKQTNKYKSKYAPKGAAEKKSSNASPSYQDSTTTLVSKPSPTLTNNSVSIGQAESKKTLTYDESLKQAAALLKWK